MIGEWMILTESLSGKPCLVHLETVLGFLPMAEATPEGDVLDVGAVVLFPGNSVAVVESVEKISEAIENLERGTRG